MKRISLENLELQYKITEYSELYRQVRILLEEGKLKPVKASGKNGKKPALYKEYWWIEEQEDFSKYREELLFDYIPLISTEYYLCHMKQYVEDRKWVQLLNEYLKTNREKLQIPKSINERSFDIWHREKFLKEEQGKKIIKRCGLFFQDLNLYETTEPMAYYVHTRKTPQNMLILENKDTFYSMRKFLLDGNRDIFGITIGTLIYGSGKGIFRSFWDFFLCSEPYMKESENVMYYLGDFIINTILSNEGKVMYFDGYDFEQRAYKAMNISYIGNKVVYEDGDVKRTSYYLTDDGYNLLLSTLEIENNMKLTIHEMIFKLHLEKQNYDKAEEEIKNVFQLLWIQLQKIQEAMLRVRRNALNYSVEDYKVLLEENLEMIGETKQKFQHYREVVKKRAMVLEEHHINMKRLSKENKRNLSHLKVIESYLNRGIDEHQKILNSHFDLKMLYEKELESLAQMSLIQRFSLRTELYDKILEDASGFENLDLFLRPLFYQHPEKIYNLEKALQLQRPLRKKQTEEQEEVIGFDAEDWQKERIKKQKEKLKKYEQSLGLLLDMALEKGSITLREIKERLEQEEVSRISVLIPEIDIFKEIMVELIKSREINLPTLRKEKSEYIVEDTLDFQLQKMVLNLVEEEKRQGIFQINVTRLTEEQAVEFSGLFDEKGVEKKIRCSDVEIKLLVNHIE